MKFSVDAYLDTLLSFVPKKKSNRLACDYVSLVHVPARGPECVYSLSFNSSESVLTIASYKETIMETLERDGRPQPELDALQATVPVDHPVFAFLNAQTLAACDNGSDGRSGMDYYLMIWQKDGMAGVVECWEPYASDNEAWLTVIGAMQVLSSQYEYMALNA